MSGTLGMSSTLGRSSLARPGEQAADEQAGHRRVLAVRAFSQHLVQHPSGEPALRQDGIDGVDAEIEPPAAGRPVRAAPLDLADPQAERVQCLRPHIRRIR